MHSASEFSNRVAINRGALLNGKDSSLDEFRQEKVNAIYIYVYIYIYIYICIYF